jgi:hypothetical protein
MTSSKVKEVTMETMTVYVIVTAFQGCINEVIGIGDRQDAETAFVQKQAELGIEPGQEGESEHDAQLHEVNVDFYPPSVRARRKLW